VLLWQAWKACAHRAAVYQTRLLLIAVYVLVLGPGALAGRLFRSPLLDLEGLSKTWWVREPPPKTLDALRRQF
jgi:hypothetical protein